jgi:hypothetical protein
MDAAISLRGGWVSSLAPRILSFHLKKHSESQGLARLTLRTYSIFHLRLTLPLGNQNKSEHTCSKMIQHSPNASAEPESNQNE